jgi:hypothetical protein
VFIFIFGSMTDDVGGFATIFVFSIALNHGVKSRHSRVRANPLAPNPRLAFSSQPVFQP